MVCDCERTTARRLWPTDTEKDFCLERFLAFAKGVTDKLIAKGQWADYIDPCSGLSMVGSSTHPTPCSIIEYLVHTTVVIHSSLLPPPPVPPAPPGNVYSQQHEKINKS